MRKDIEKDILFDLFGFSDICDSEARLINGASCCGVYTPIPGCGGRVYGNECYDGGVPKNSSSTGPTGGVTISK